MNGGQIDLLPEITILKRPSLIRVKAKVALFSGAESSVLKNNSLVHTL